jgi:hypothetical protein
LHGGYIDPNSINPDNIDFYGNSIDPSISYTIYLNEKVSIYINDINSYTYPTIAEIEERLEKYILIKVQESIDLNTFEQQGIHITGPDVDFSSGYILTDEVSIDVKIRENDIIVNLKYLFEIEKDNSKTIIKDFSYVAP